MFTFPRTELLPTVIFEGPPILDEDPVILPSGRPIPGPSYSKDEFNRLTELAADISERPTPLPTQYHLGRITLNPAMGCWELPVYQDNKPRARYGIMEIRSFPDDSKLAHRTMYRVFYGADAIPPGRNNFLDHLCCNKTCCYPRHLELVSPGVNTLRGREKISYGQLNLDEFFGTSSI